LNYSGKVVYTEDATLIITLPTINPTSDSTPSSSNNIGATFRIAISTAATAVAIKTDGVDKFVGSVLMVDTDSSGAVSGYAPASSNDVINLNGTTTGGISGSYVDITAVANDKYMVTGVLLGSGSVATPFADA
jgi:predicted homoserine dehydrogenase-like protein